MLKYEGKFNQSGQVVKESHYAYEFDSTAATPGYIVQILLSNLLGNTYESKGYFKKQSQVITNLYMPGSDSINQVVQISNYASPYHHQLTDQRTIYAASDTAVIKNKYTTDFRISHCDTISTGLNTYNSACSNCDATLSSAYASCSTIACQYNAWLANTVCRANARVTYITRRRDNFTNPSNHFSACLLTAKNNADADLKPLLQAQRQGIVAVAENSTFKNSLLLRSNFIKLDFVSSPNDRVYFSRLQKISLAVPANAFSQVITSSGNTSLLKDSRYKDEMTYNYSAGNITDFKTHDGIPYSYLWDYQRSYPCAKVAGANASQVAYSSFEADGSGNLTISTPADTVSGDGVTGNYCYAINGGLTRTSLDPSRNYVVSLWTKGGVPNYSGTNAGTTVVASGNSWTNGKTINGWTYREKVLTGVTNILISGGGGKVDEVRIYPVGSLMTTYTYFPLVGMQTECDANNRVRYYEYDKLGRLTAIRDENGKVLKAYDYQYQATNNQ
jgi:YD repeat-containing protein